jgi:hypothetical protein
LLLTAYACHKNNQQPWTEHILCWRCPVLLFNRGIWPNALLFSPTATYGTFSYAETMITPLAAAMRDAIAQAAQLGQLYTPPDAARPVVFMALQGELLAVACLRCVLALQE